MTNGNDSGPPSLQRLQAFNASAAGLQGALPNWGAPYVLPPGQAPTLTELILGHNRGLAGARGPSRPRLGGALTGVVAAMQTVTAPLSVLWVVGSSIKILVRYVTRQQQQICRVSLVPLPSRSAPWKLL